MQTLIAFTIILFFANISALKAQVYSVTLDIQSKDKTTQEQAESYLARELRSLRDVRIVKDADILIRGFVTKTETFDRIHKGYALSIVVVKRSVCTDRIVKKGEVRQFWECDTLVSAYLNTGGIAELRNMCEDYITSFDTDVLKPLRESKREPDVSDVLEPIPPPLLKKKPL